MWRLIVFLLCFLPAASTAQPSYLPGENWTRLGENVIRYVQADGDTAWVYPTPNGDYARIQDGGDWLLHSPGMGNNTWSLSSIMSDLSDVQGVVRSLVTKGEVVGFPPGVFEKAESVRKLWLHLDTLLAKEAEIPGHPKETVYADECAADPNNATLHVPPNADFYGVRPPSLGDTLAVRNGGGRCVGWGAWTEGGTTIGVAQEREGSAGLVAGEQITLEVHLAGTGRAYVMDRIVWAECDTVSSVPRDLCREGTYESEAFFEVAEAHFDPLG